VPPVFFKQPKIFYNHSTMSAPNSSHHHPPKQKESTALPAKPENNFGNLPEDTGLTVE
jgi:hypothetical protein